MKKLYSKLENTIYYGFSRTFWHLISFAGVLGIIGGILVFAWSYVPPSKQKIAKQPLPVKPSYPNPVNVTFEDVYMLIPKEESKIQQERKQIYDEPQQMSSSTIETVEDPQALASFNLQIGQLKAAIPEATNRAFWKGKGNYQFIDERKYKITKSEAYRKFVYTSPGFETKFVKYTDNQGIQNYNDKAKLLNSLNNIIPKVDQSLRTQLLDQFMLNRISEMNTTIRNLESISNILYLFPKEDVLNTFNNLLNSSNRNIDNAETFIKFLNELLAKFPLSERYTTLKTIQYELNNYRSNFNEFIEITNGFSPLMSKFSQDQQSLALKYYFNAYRNKNQDRIQAISKIDQEYLDLTNAIDQEYQMAIASEETAFFAKKAIKNEFKTKSMYGVGLGVGIIVLITIILLLLAMIRNVNKLAQVILDDKQESS